MDSSQFVLNRPRDVGRFRLPQSRLSCDACSMALADSAPF